MCSEAAGETTPPMPGSAPPAARRSLWFALNDMYDPADRWEEKKILPGLLNVPRDFIHRSNQVLEGPFDEDGAIERVREFDGLADDVLKLAEAEVDRYRQRRR